MTEIVSLVVTVKINIEQHLLYLPELTVTPITLYFFQTKYKYKVSQMRLYDKQRYNFNRIYKCHANKYYTIQQNSRRGLRMNGLSLALNT